MVACLDTMILVWGVRRQCTMGQEDRVYAADALFEQFENDGTRLLIPTPVLSEYLVRVPRSQWEDVLDVFRTEYIIGTYDAKAALIAAELYTKRVDTLKPEEITDLGGKRELKVDCQVVAVAISHNADILCSDDKGVRHVAGDRIRVVRLAEIPVQTRLFK